MSERTETSGGPNGGSCDVIVVGAGPTGLMAAALLARNGIAVRILDKSPGPAKESRAMVVQARSLELLLGMGLAESFLDAGLIVTGARIFVDGRPAASLAFDDIGRVDTPYSFPLMIPQSATESILAADLDHRGIAIDYGAEVTGLEQDASGVSVHVRDRDGENVLRTSFVVGADGAHSLVRKALGLSFEGAAYPQDFLLADCTVDWPLEHGLLSIFVRDRLFAAYFPMRGSGRARIIAVSGGDGDKAAPVATQGSTDVSLAEVEAVLREATRTEVTLRDPTWTSRYRVHHRGVDRYGVGRVFVAGDAAHIHSPAGGQGMNTGLQDAANLAWKLAAVVRGGAQPALLDSYHAERWPVGRKILERTDKLFTGMTSQSPLVAGLRNAALPWVGGALMRSATVRAKAFHFISELGIRYPTGPFVQDDLSPDAPKRWRTGFRAGFRAPDGRINRDRDVFDLLAGNQFTLLALSSRALNAEDVASIVAALETVAKTPAGLACRAHLIARSLIGRDPRLIQAESNEVFGAYGIGHDAPTGLFLIRPDGYVAYRSDRLSVEGLTTFLATFFGHA